MASFPPEGELDALWTRYSRQILVPGLGRAGQERLAAAQIAIVGCGAVGSAQAELLVRAGVGAVTLIDRDFVDWSNLQRQQLFTEADARESVPKAIAAARRLAAINSSVRVAARVADLSAASVGELLAGAQLILDGTDNFTARYLLNDFAVAHAVPWIYGAAVGAYGATFTVVPGRTACLQCLFGGPPEGPVETCETAGVLNAVVSWVASLQAMEAIKLLAGAENDLRPSLIAADLWRNEFPRLRVPQRDLECSVCARREFTHLRARQPVAVVLCGRNSVQVHERHQNLDLAILAARLEPWGRVRRNEFVLKFYPAKSASPPALELTIFPDGRAIVIGTSDTGLARAAYARYVGA